MATKRQILERLNRRELLAAVDTFDLAVPDRRKRGLLVGALADSQDAPLPSILVGIELPRLREVCQDLGLDSRGTEATLVERLARAQRRDLEAERPPGGQGSLFIHPRQHTFTVDTHIFRELGELLVGRDSTALVELIKNAYDADAQDVVVYGQALSDSEQGYIKIIDRQGNGMFPDEFMNGFLRIASRLKVKGKRLSRRYQRHYTGAKGIGRLAAHKLAREMEVDTVPWVERPRGERLALKARIDWDQVEKCETLEELGETKSILFETFKVPARTPSGTEITLKRLRGTWSPAERKRFIDEVQTSQPAPFLVGSIAGLLAEKLLFEVATVKGKSSARDPGFQVHLEGDFEPGEDYWDVIAQAANWVIEIEAKPVTGYVEYGIGPTRRNLQDAPEAETARFELNHETPLEGPFFQARILVRGSRKGSSDVKEWARRSTGVRVFVEGFRVPPYGEKGNDWLELDADYNQRTRPIRRLQELGFNAHPQAGLHLLPGTSYFGAVIMTQEGAAGLRPLVNREGFVPDALYRRLVDMVRIGIDLTTRHRAALSHRGGELRKKRAAAAGVSPITPGRTLADSLTKVTALYQEARASAFAGNLDRAVKLVQQLEQPLQAVVESHGEASEGSAMLRVLASLGNQMADFVHEINNLLEMAQSIEHQLDELRTVIDIPSHLRLMIGALSRAAAEMRLALERQAAYLVDITTPDARRRRSRQRLRDVLDSAYRLKEREAERRKIRLFNKIPDHLTSPPMFKAEMMAVYTNLLTNAVKAAGTSGRIRATGKEVDGTIVLKLENTGAIVDVAEGERWFQPFRSTTVDVDPSLGRGMGLGLTITRSMLEEYGATIRFVRPSPEFSTALEIIFPTTERGRR
jgi:signal transduction histidine kinase